MVYNLLHLGCYFATGSFIGSFAYYLWLKYVHYSENELYFLRKENTICEGCVAVKTPGLCQLDTCSYFLILKISKLIRSAKHSVSVVNPCLDVDEIKDALIEAQRNGCIVTILHDLPDDRTKCIMECMAAGIQEKTRQLHSVLMMHCKFTIIDQQVVICGSINFTKRSFMGNFENIQFFRRKDVVTFFQKLGEDLWNNKHSMHLSRDDLEFIKSRVLGRQK